MKTILIAFAFIPIFAVGQTRVGLAYFSDGSTKPLEELTKTPIDTIYYVADDLLSREVNDSVFLAQGKEVLISGPHRKIAYTWTKKLTTTVQIFGKYQNGEIFEIKKITKEESFPWMLIYFFLGSFLVATLLQRAVVFGSSATIDIGWGALGGGMSFIVMVVSIQPSLDEIWGVAVWILLVAVFIIACLMATLCKDVRTRNIWILVFFILTILFLVTNKLDLMPLWVTIAGTLLGLLMIYPLRGWQRRNLYYRGNARPAFF